MDSIAAESSPTDCVKVAVRVRPLIARERGCTDIAVFCDPKANEITIGESDEKRFTYNYVFGINSKQEEIYSQCITPLLDSAFEGYNATVLAYGQTGSGKTYTMGTAGRVTNPSDVGIVPRVIDDIFQRKSKIEQDIPGSEVVVHVSFLEIYAENVRDLLEFDQSVNREVLIRSDDQGGVKVIGQKTQQVTSAEELQEVLDTGSLYRATGNTSMNAFSSRSHAIFTIYIDQEIPLNDEEQGEDGEKRVDTRQSKFHFVDLAGSERASRTNSEGQRMKEGIDINRGLLALGKVIRALGDEKNKGTYPPYRESKLTRLLMDSLGGNAKTLMIACVSPASDSLNESLGSLRYANSAKNIQNKPKLNKDKESNLITQLRLENQQLRELISLQGDADSETLLKLVRKRIGQSQEEQFLEKYEEEREQLEERAVSAENRVKSLEEEMRKLKQELEEERSKTTQLEVELEYRKQHGLNQELTDEEAKNVSLLIQYKTEIEQLNKQLQKRDDQIMELVDVNKKQVEENIDNKMTIIDLKYRTCAEMEYEIVNRIQDKITKEQTETEDDLSESIEEVGKEVSFYQSTLQKKYNSLVDKLVEKQTELAKMKEKQKEYEKMTGEYENELNELNARISEMEKEKEILQRDLKLIQEKGRSIGSKEVSTKGELETQLKKKNDEISRIREQKNKLERTVSNLRATSDRINKLTKDISNLQSAKDNLQKTMDQANHQHRQQMEEKKREITFLQRQTKDIMRENTKLQQNTRKIDSLLHQEKGKNEQLQKQLKDLKLSSDIQKREFERTSKEERKYVQLLEKQLREEKKRYQQISRLQKQKERQEAAKQRYKDLVKEKTMRQRKRMLANKTAEMDLEDRYEQEEMEDAIEQARAEADMETIGVDDMERVIKDRVLNQEKVLNSFKNMKREDAVAMLIVIYKKLLEYMNEINELSKSLGNKEENIGTLNQEIKRLKRTIQVQKSNHDTALRNLKMDFESQLFELQQAKQEELHTIIRSKYKTGYERIKEQYKDLVVDHETIKKQRDSLYAELKMLQNSQEGPVKPTWGVAGNDVGIEYNQEAFNMLLKSMSEKYGKSGSYDQVLK